MTGRIALPDGVVGLIPDYLGRQRWFGGGSAPAAADVTVIDADELAVAAGGTHRLLWAVVNVRSEGPDRAEQGAAETSTEGAAAMPAGHRYQLLIGARPNAEHAEFLPGHESAVLGSVGGCCYYDATVDPELARALLSVITSGAHQARRVRSISAEQSNTSLIYDDRLIAKVFRMLHEGANPDVEVTSALAQTGFDHVAAPVAVWRRDGTDLAFVQQFLAGGTEGWALALTSLRDLYSARPDDPSDAGDDFAAEASRLGRMTAEMHLALVEAYGVDLVGFAGVGWPCVVRSVEERLHPVVGGAPAEIMAELHAVTDPGPAIRVHGDYHLGQVMRTDSGWFALDFEGEPARPLSDRQAFTSAYKDVTGMLRSFHYAAHFALLEREDHEADELVVLGEAWETHNRQAFIDGYLGSPGITALLPERPEVRAVMSLAFELDKALYELAYEQAYRPAWVSIPRNAIQRLLAGDERGVDPVAARPWSGP